MMLLFPSSLVTREAGVCQGTRLAFAGFSGAEHCVRYFAIFSCNYWSHKPSRFFSFLVCLFFLSSESTKFPDTGALSFSGPFGFSGYL